MISGCRASAASALSPVEGPAASLAARQSHVVARAAGRRTGDGPAVQRVGVGLEGGRARAPWADHVVDVDPVERHRLVAGHASGLPPPTSRRTPTGRAATARSRRWPRSPHTSPRWCRSGCTSRHRRRSGSGRGTGAGSSQPGQLDPVSWLVWSLRSGRVVQSSVPTCRASTKKKSHAGSVSRVT